MKKSKTVKEFFELNFKKFLLLSIILTLIIILFSSLFRYFNHDEMEAIHTAWKIINGEKIYIDFFQHHHPAFYWFLLPVVFIFNNSANVLFAARLVMFFCLIIIAFLTYKISKMLFDGLAGLISVILLLSTLLFVDKAMEIRPDVLMTLFSLLSLFMLFKFLFKKKQNEFSNKILLILSAFFLSISFLFLQKAIFFIFIIMCLWLFNLIKAKITMNEFLIFIGVFLLSFVPYFAYLFITKQFSNYIFYNWIINMNFVQKGLPTAILSYKHNAILWLFFLIGLLFYLKDSILKEFGFVTIGLLVSILFYKIPLPQYYMLLIPLVAIIGSLGVSKVFYKRKIYFIIFSFVLLSPMFLLIKETVVKSNKAQIKLINYVLSITNQRDFVYDGDIQFNLFRKDLDYFWYSLQNDGGLATYRKLKNYEYNIYTLIQHKRPKIISDCKINNENEIIKKYYKKLDKIDNFKYNLYIRKK